MKRILMTTPTSTPSKVCMERMRPREVEKRFAFPAEKLNEARPMAEYKKGMKIVVNDKMQTGYQYTLMENPGEHLGFEPGLTPLEMLSLGSFDGMYLRDMYKELPREWYQMGRFSNNEKRDESVNYFGVSSRQTLQEWQRKGWIMGDDIRGWFQWYCRYWLGRRDPQVDIIQIGRYKAIARHRGAIVKNCMHKKNSYGGCISPMICRPKQRQTLLNWAWNPFV